MTRYLHTMYRITDPDRSRAFYDPLGFEFRREMDIVRDGETGAPRGREAGPRRRRSGGRSSRP
jgi:catechol 2,3-dioxygenase-like lactoylglutathione lyase family enzyme